MRAIKAIKNLACDSAKKVVSGVRTAVSHFTSSDTSDQKTPTAKLKDRTGASVNDSGTTKCSTKNCPLSSYEKAILNNWGTIKDHKALACMLSLAQILLTIGLTTKLDFTLAEYIANYAPENVLSFLNLNRTEAWEPLILMLTFACSTAANSAPAATICALLSKNKNNENSSKLAKKGTKYDSQADNVEAQKIMQKFKKTSSNITKCASTIAATSACSLFADDIGYALSKIISGTLNGSATILSKGLDIMIDGVNSYSNFIKNPSIDPVVKAETAVLDCFANIVGKTVTLGSAAVSKCGEFALGECKFFLNLTKDLTLWTAKTAITTPFYVLKTVGSATGSVVADFVGHSLNGWKYALGM